MPVLWWLCVIYFGVYGVGALAVSIVYLAGRSPKRIRARERKAGRDG